MNPDDLNIPKPINPTTPNSENKGKDFLISPLRTYEEDVKQAVKKDNISTAKIMLAEQRKRDLEKEVTEETSIKSGRNITRIVISIILVILGVGSVSGAYFYYNYKIKKQNDIAAPVLITKNDFIDIDSSTKINRSNFTGREVLAQIRNIIRNSEADMADKTIREIKITKNITQVNENKESQVEVEIETEEFMSIIESRIPDQLLRNLDKKFFFGIYKNNTLIEPFIVFRVQDYEISYAKMFEWENFLTKDIQDIFYKTLGSSQKFIGDTETEILPENTATEEQETLVENSSTTTTKPNNDVGYDFRAYKDLILDNRDTRAIVDTNNKLLFFYSFTDRKHLIMTTKLEILTAIITRLNSAKLIR